MHRTPFTDPVFLIGLFCILIVSFGYKFKKSKVLREEFFPYMEKNHPKEWADLSDVKKDIETKGDIQIRRRPEYKTSMIFRFLWRSSETFGDENVVLYRKKIKFYVTSSCIVSILIFFAMICFQIASGRWN